MDSNRAARGIGVVAVAALSCGAPAAENAVPLATPVSAVDVAPKPSNDVTTTADAKPVEGEVAAPSPSPPSPAGTISPSLAGFDCQSSLEEKQGLRLRDDNAGPLGATWNWHAGALRCGARLLDTCTGPVTARLHVGDRHVVEIARKGSAEELTFDVPPTTWTAALRSPPKLPYETLSIAIEVLVLCDDGPLHFADAFVGRFGSGE